MSEATNIQNTGKKAPPRGAIFLIGFMGCGKTHWAKELSKTLALPYFDLDEKIEEQTQKSIPQIFAEKGEEHFRKIEKEILYLITESHENFVMATGGGTPCFFNNIDYLKKSGTVVWINCSIDCLYHRLIKEKDQRPLISQIPDAKLKAYIVKKFSSRKIFYQQAHVIINEDEVNLNNLIERIYNS